MSLSTNNPHSHGQCYVFLVSRSADREMLRKKVIVIFPTRLYNHLAMKKNIHPQNYIAAYVCNSCKTKFEAISTVDGTINVEVCANCHPFYTGKAGVIVDSFSRVDRFNRLTESKNTDQLQLKKRKKIERKLKTSEIKAGPSLTLKDMMKQAGK